jgi:predicted MPP superfamily phosphohydrolase
MRMPDLPAVKELLIHDGRLIRLPEQGKAVFIGDTHGDFEATEEVFRRYFKPGYILVFLGDYVDRGDQSRENLEFLLNKKQEAPNQVFLLMGNHEGYCMLPFYPADFWESLTTDENALFSEIFQFLPFAAITNNGLIAVHGVPPDVHETAEINNIHLCSSHWQQLTWADFVNTPGEFIEEYGGRPTYGEDYFKRTMKQLSKNVLIRSHQPHAKPILFDKRCLTLMTSLAYSPLRTIAIADLEEPIIETVEDLDILDI